MRRQPIGPPVANKKYSVGNKKSVRSKGKF